MLAAGKLRTKPPQVTAPVPGRWALRQLRTKPLQVTAPVPGRWALRQWVPHCLLCAPGVPALTALPARPYTTWAAWEQEARPPQPQIRRGAQPENCLQLWEHRYTGPGQEELCLCPSYALLAASRLWVQAAAAQVERPNETWRKNQEHEGKAHGSAAPRVCAPGVRSLPALPHVAAAGSSDTGISDVSRSTAWRWRGAAERHRVPELGTSGGREGARDGNRGRQQLEANAAAVREQQGGILGQDIKMSKNAVCCLELQPEGVTRHNSKGSSCGANPGALARAARLLQHPWCPRCLPVLAEGTTLLSGLPRARRTGAHRPDVAVCEQP
ncbi:hypothetical protein Anapl_03424 [Anas platyrhynchos]|uniref:Uncharacterized protein n=1 Tax=Anas platyrhynchos TaxID=8839 RepID=R0LL89_ANAPL|nr:hypothetical protein Anapl_03424 [Anas platyrhynchos]